jgi:hypothetical protein
MRLKGTYHARRVEGEAGKLGSSKIEVGFGYNRQLSIVSSEMSSL